MFSPFQIFSLTCSRLSARLLMRHLLPCAASVSGYFRSPFYNVDARILFPNESFVNILCRILSLFTYFFSCFVHFRESSCGHTVLYTKVTSSLSSFFVSRSIMQNENASYTKHHTPTSALRALCFPPTGPPFSHWPKRIHSSPSRSIESRPYCCTFFYPALPHVALLSSSLCKKMPPPIGKHLPKRCKNNARHKNKAQAVSACALSHTISPLAAPMVCRWGHSSSFN